MTEAPTKARPHTLSLRVSGDELEWLRQVAEREERSISWVLRHALRQLVDQNGKK